MAVSGEHWAATLFGVLSFPKLWLLLCLFISIPAVTDYRAHYRATFLKCSGEGCVYPRSGDTWSVLPSISITLPDIPVSVFYPNTSTTATAIAVATTEALYTSETWDQR